MTPEQFINHYPQLYHMADAGTWDSIVRHGLLSTVAILDLLNIAPAERTKLETQRRPATVTLTHQEHGTFNIRDQKPIRDSMLARCLRGVSIPEWYSVLNGQVFFWPTRERALTLLGARAYRGRAHLVITVDSRELLSRHGDRVLLSPINSGATVYQPTERGRDTFKTLADWPAAVGPRSKRLLRAVAEVAVRHGVPDIAEYVVRVEEMSGDRVVRTVV